MRLEDKILEMIHNERKGAITSLEKLNNFILSHRYLPSIRIPRFIFTNPCGEKFLLVPYALRGGSYYYEYTPYFSEWHFGFSIYLKKEKSGTLVNISKDNSPRQIAILINCSDKPLLDTKFSFEGAYRLLQFFRRIRRWAEERLDGLERAQAELEKQQRYKAFLAAEISIKKLGEL